MAHPTLAGLTQRTSEYQGYPTLEELAKRPSKFHRRQDIEETTTHALPNGWRMIGGFNRARGRYFCNLIDSTGWWVDNYDFASEDEAKNTLAQVAQRGKE